MVPDKTDKREPGRNRIVISLDQPRHAASPSPRRRRWPRLLAIVGITGFAILLVAAGGLFLWWQHYKTTPAYSLALLADAAQRNDMVDLDRMVDSDTIVRNLAAQVSEKAAGRYGIALSSAVRLQIESLVPGLLLSLKQQVRDGLAVRIREISDRSGHKPFLILAIALPYFVDITVAGDTAKATATSRDRPLEIDLQRAGEGWKVIAVRNDAMIQSIVDEIVKYLPAIGQGDDTEIRSQLKKLRAKLRKRPDQRR